MPSAASTARSFGSDQTVILLEPRSRTSVRRSPNSVFISRAGDSSLPLFGADRHDCLDSKDGEMAEWLKAHAWKLIPVARADAHQSPPTHVQSTTSRNNDKRRHVPVNDGV